MFDFFWISNCTQENNIKMDLKNITLEGEFKTYLKYLGYLLWNLPASRAVWGKNDLT
jgi:hypothetical protein